MMELGLYERLNIENAHIKNCLDALKKIKIINKEKVINKELLKYLNNGEVNPCYLHCILKNINESKLVNMMVMCMSIFMTEKEIRKIQCEDDLEEDLNSMSREIEKRPSGIWRQTGYLHSSLDLLIKCTILTNRK